MAKPLPTDKKACRALADRYYSKVRRLEESEDGWVVCVSCDRRYWWKDVDAGHFEGRGSNSVRYEDSNVHPQCPGCNRGGAASGAAGSGGGEAGYALYMLNRYGRKKLEQLKRMKNTSVTYTVSDYHEMIQDFKKRLVPYKHLL